MKGNQNRVKSVFVGGKSILNSVIVYHILLKLKQTDSKVMYTLLLIIGSLSLIFLAGLKRFHTCICDNCKSILILPITKYSIQRFIKNPSGKESNVYYRVLCPECKQATRLHNYMNRL
jgi:hypothetical protein